MQLSIFDSVIIPGKLESDICILKNNPLTTRIFAFLGIAKFNSSIF